MSDAQCRMPFGRREWWDFLLVELPVILKRDPRVIRYIEREFKHPDLLGFVCLEDICAKNYHTTEGVINDMIRMFESYDWSESDNEKMTKRFLSLKEEVTRLQADGEDHSYVAQERRPGQYMPSGEKQWGAFLVAELRELLGRDPRVAQDERFAQCTSCIFSDWLNLCTLYYRETNCVALNIFRLIEADFAAYESLRWTPGRDDRIMSNFVILKDWVTRLQADGEDHSYAAWKCTRPFHSDAPIGAQDRLCLYAGDLSVHSYNRLIRSGIESISQLKSLSEEQIQSIPGMGRVSLKEVLEFQRYLLHKDDGSRAEELDADG